MDKNLKTFMGEATYNDLLRKASIQKPFGLSIGEMSREDLIVTIAAMLLAVHSDPEREKELIAFGRAAKKAGI